MLVIFIWLFQVPFFHFILELLLVIWILRLLTRKSYNPKETKLDLTKEVIVLKILFLSSFSRQLLIYY